MGKRGTRAAKVHRQGIVRSLMARGMEQHEILHQLSTDKRYADEYVEQDGEYLPNPHFVGNVQTGEPVNKATISRDWREILAQWRAEALGDIDDHLSRQFAELREAKRIAQKAKDMRLWAILNAQEMKLLGTPRPEKMEYRWDDEQIGKVDKLKHLFQEMRQREVKHDDDT